MRAPVRRAPPPASPASTVSTTSAARFAQRARSQRWHASRPLLALLVLVTLGIAAGWVVLASPVFAVREVSVRGTRELAPADVLAAADIPTGMPIARLDVSAVQARVEALPRVADVAVDRGWRGDVALVVSERRPAALLVDGDRYAIVDSQGVAFDVTAKRVAGLPVVRATGPRPRDSLRSALAVLAALPPRLRAELQEVEAASTEDVRLAMGKGRTVVWGSPNRSARKALVLGALMTRPADVYDVSAPDAPTTR